MRAGVVINAGAASVGCRETLIERIHTLFKREGIVSEIEFSNSSQIDESVQRHLACGCDALVAAGGDGTISSAAAACVNNQIPLGILPLGTHNHFAKDLHLPLTLEAAVRVIASGNLSAVDIGRVNEHFFINNSSIGAYPRAVERRGRIESRFGLHRKIAMILATLFVFAKRPALDALLVVNGEEIRRITPFVFIGNNGYTVDLFNVRFRTALDSGILCVYTARCHGLLDFFNLLLLAAAGRLANSPDLETRFASEVTIHLPRRSVRVAKDGEVLHLAPPLRYSIEKQALKVFTPSA